MDLVPFRRIAVAIDGSETASAALTVAIDLAKRYSADLLVVAVAPLPPVFSSPSEPLVPAAVPSDPVPHYRELVEAAVAQARSAGVTSVTGVCEEGVVVEEVLGQIAAHRSDLLVVGSRGLSAARRLLLGSVSTALVTHAPAPVLVVRPPTKLEGSS
ncbi:MAG TPA: universal stress protein [Thermoplasmata archaeon]|nr:universal stress protein [Thermoplasmata archaeon]